jgi:hypothetical protein
MSDTSSLSSLAFVTWVAFVVAEEPQMSIRANRWDKI